MKRSLAVALGFLFWSVVVVAQQPDGGSIQQTPAFQEVADQPPPGFAIADQANLCRAGADICVYYDLSGGSSGSDPGGLPPDVAVGITAPPDLSGGAPAMPTLVTENSSLSGSSGGTDSTNSGSGSSSGGQSQPGIEYSGGDIPIAVLSSPILQQARVVTDVMGRATMVGVATIGAGPGGGALAFHFAFPETAKAIQDFEKKFELGNGGLVQSAVPTGGEQLPVLQISRRLMPNIAENIEHAQAAGHPRILSYGGDMAANRDLALRDVPKLAGLERDEYPFNSTLEGGEGAWVGHVPAIEQRIQGGILRNFYLRNALEIGEEFEVEVVP